jgi:multiple sugar transport system substrate-binding protein
MSLHTGLISSRSDVVNDPAVQAKVPYFKQVSTILNEGYNRPKLKSYNQFTTILQEALNSTLGKQSSPREALDTAQAQISLLT